MATRIEILSRSADSVTAAFYFSININDREPGAVDATRQPAGKRLSAGEIVDLQNGELHEVIRQVGTITRTNIETPLTNAQIMSLLSSMWTNGAARALADYKNRFQAVGFFWDGSTWSNS